MIEDLLRYGSELEISGFIMANGQENHLVYFPNSYAHHDLVMMTGQICAADECDIKIIQPTHEEMKELLYQMDTLGVLDLQKTILRKSQRQIDDSIRWRVFHRDGYKCRYCGKGDGEALTVDHIVLWEHMGATEEDNLNSSCRKCNKTRGSMLYLDWLKSSYYQKVILNFGVDDLTYGAPEHEITNKRWEWAHQRNVRSWVEAQKVKLRPSNRNR